MILVTLEEHVTSSHVCFQDHVLGFSTLASLHDYNWALGQFY